MTAPDQDEEVLLRNGMRVRYRVSGAGDPVLVLHGVGCSLEDVDEQVDLLSGRYRCWAVDLPRFGGTDPMPVPGSVARLGAFVATLLEEFWRCTAEPVPAEPVPAEPVPAGSAPHGGPS